MKEKTISERGITLIALVITIIVLIILAMVSIKIVTSEGLIKRAENATTKNAEESEKEAIQLAYAEYQISQYSNDTIDEANIKDEELKSDYEKLKAYFVGKNLSEFIIEDETTDDIIILKYNDEKLIIYNKDVVENNDTYTFIIQYNGYYYKFTFTVNNDNDKITKIEILNKKFKIDNATITTDSDIGGWNIEFNDTHNKYEISENGTVSNITNAWWKMTADEKKELKNCKFENSGNGNEWGYFIKGNPSGEGGTLPIVAVYNDYGIENVYIVIIFANDGLYFYLPNDNAVNAYFQKMNDKGYTVDTSKKITSGKWYKSTDGSNFVNGDEYTGESLISEDDLNNSETRSKTYLEKIMKSFN